MMRTWRLHVTVTTTTTTATAIVIVTQCSFDAADNDENFDDAIDKVKGGDKK